MAASTHDATAVSALGTLADGVVGSGLPDGRLQLELAGIEIDWWIGADDGWKLATTSRAFRPGVAPAIEARVRLPGGEAVLRAYAVTQSGVPLVVADLENASPGAAVVAWVVRAATGYRIGEVALEGTTLRIDERARIELPRVPSRWAVEPRATGVHDRVIEGRAAAGRFEPVTTRRGNLEIALLFPIAHRTRTRIAASAGVATNTSDAKAVARLPSLADVERGWVAALERGTGVELPDERMQVALDAARATLVLGAAGDPGRDRVVATELVAWGFAPGRPGRRGSGDTGDPWPLLNATIGASGSSPRRAAEWLRSLREAVVRVTRNGVDLLPHFPHAWLGQPVAVHDLPTPHGPVSFALRWHGAKPALLWDVPAGTSVRAPGLDESWTSGGGAGEALLAEIDPTRLLPLRTTSGSDPGVIVDEPGSFT
jgi:hypothetical protein